MYLSTTEYREVILSQGMRIYTSWLSIPVMQTKAYLCLYDLTVAEHQHKHTK